MIVKTKGIVLSETPYSETSKVLNVLTSDYGLIGVMSKGCRNVKNKLRGISNKMCYAEYSLNYKERGLSTLVEGSIINSFYNIFTDIKRASYSQYLMDLCYQVLKDNNTKDIFNLLEASLIKINMGFNPEFIVDIVEIKLLKYLGVDFCVDNCVHCGEKENILTIDINNGGLICKSCYIDGFVFKPETIKLIRLMYYVDISKIDKLDYDDKIVMAEINLFIKEYYETYTGIYLRDKNKINIQENQ